MSVFELFAIVLASLLTLAYVARQLLNVCAGADVVDVRAWSGLVFRTVVRSAAAVLVYSGFVAMVYMHSGPAPALLEVFIGTAFVAVLEEATR